MWPFTKNTTPTFTVENTIAAGTRVRGVVTGPDGFRVDGTVEGSLDAEGPVVIGETGVVEGDVRARDIVVLGRIRGDVKGAHLEIGPKGKVLGDITVESFRMQKGGVFRGASCMEAGEETVAPKLPVSLGLGPVPVITSDTSDAQRGRTLPPPTGAVPPPPALAVVARSTAVRDALDSHQRIVTTMDTEPGLGKAVVGKRA